MQNSKDYKVKEHMPLKLLKNRSYPTYQLYGTIRNKTNSEQSMVIAVLETMSWLRKRFRDMIVSELKSSIEDKDAKIERLKEQIKEFEVKNNGWQKENLVYHLSV